MSRPAIAVLVFVVGFTAYVAAVATLADHVIGLHWLAQALYFVVAGIAWAWPARSLMFWAARGR
jgi:hypothetical protein